jgi:hypothetical protein
MNGVRAALLVATVSTMARAQESAIDMADVCFRVRIVHWESTIGVAIPADTFGLRLTQHPAPQIIPRRDVAHIEGELRTPAIFSDTNAHWIRGPEAQPRIIVYRGGSESGWLHLSLELTDSTWSGSIALNEQVNRGSREEPRYRVHGSGRISGEHRSCWPRRKD